MKEKVLLSIICPIYNGEKTIGKLIDSLETQKFKNYELILVNDGSKDFTLKIIKEYSKKYKNIVIIDKVHSGVSNTRNIGIKYAKGKYITFCDCDDYYKEDYFNIIVPLIEKEDFELLIFNICKINEGKLTYTIPSKYKSCIFEEKNGVREYLKGKFGYKISNSPCNKIYVKEIIKRNKIEFPENKKIGEDLIFNLMYVAKIKKYKYIDESLYYYILRGNPITSRDYRKNDLKEMLGFYIYIKNVCIENSIKNWEQYAGLFFLRGFPGVVLNETNNINYKNGKKNISVYLHSREIKVLLEKVRIKDLDLKLFIAYVGYKFELYRIIYYILWNFRNNKK